MVGVVVVVGMVVVMVGLLVVLVGYCGVKKVWILFSVWVWWNGGSEFRNIWL